MRRWTAEEIEHISEPLPPGGVPELARMLGRSLASVNQKRSKLGIRESPPPETCSVDDCDRKPHARGFCATHYSQWNRTGDPVATRPKRKRRPGSPLQIVTGQHAAEVAATIRAGKQIRERPTDSYAAATPADVRRRRARRRVEAFLEDRELARELASY